MDLFINFIFMLIALTLLDLFIFIFLVIKNALDQCDSIQDPCS